jgi:exosome complex RNA-binding protein Csl4
MRNLTRNTLTCAPGGSAPPSEGESVIGRIVAAQREELETEITGIEDRGRAGGGGGAGIGG